MTILQRILDFFRRRRTPLARDQVVSDHAVHEAHRVARAMELQIAVRMLGKPVYFEADGKPQLGVLAWAGLEGEPITVTSGTWAPGMASLWLQENRERIEPYAKTGYLVLSQDRWYTPSKIASA